MLTVNITYHANTRLMEITSISTGGADNAIATTGDHLSTRLQFTFDDPDNTLLDYGKRVDFGVIVADSDGHAFNPFIVLNNENYVDIPEEILSNVKCGVLPIQLVMGISDEGNETVLQSLNQINLAINKAIDSDAVCPEIFYPRVRDAVVDVEYDDTSSTFKYTRLDGTPIFINLTDLSEEHYEVQHYADLDTLTDAESGDTATVLDTGVWYKLYISHGIRAWYPMSGNATVNGTQTGTPVFYAPYLSGQSEQYLESRGENNSPEWVSKVASITTESDALPTTTAVKTYVDTETTRATTAEGLLDDKIDLEIQNRIDDVDAEELRATTAEDTLDDKIDAEIQNRIDDVDSEETRAKASEDALDDKIDLEIQNRIADVDAEETRAKGVESNLNTAIGNEVIRATNRENAIAGDLADEVTARQTAVSNEADARQQADATLQDNIDTLASQTQTALNTKRDKITAPHTSNPVVYTQSYDSQSTSYTEGLYDLTDNTTGGTIPVRNSSGKLTSNGTADGDADTIVSTKGYTDTKDALKIDKANIVTGDWQSTADNTHVPSELLTKTKIDAVQTNLDTHTSDTSNPHSVTKAQVGLGSVENQPMDSTPVENSPKYVTSGGIYTAIKTVQDDLDGHEADTSNPHSVTKAQVGLGNCDNTSDADKPVSTAQQTALDGKLDDSQLVTAWSSTVSNDNIPSEKLTKDTLDTKVDKTTTVNGHALSGNVTVSKSDVGLGNCDNTSDLNKPISTATQTALDGKVDKTTTVNGHALSSNVSVTKADVGLGNCDNTSDMNKPVSTAQQTALDGKLDDSQLVNTFTGHISDDTYIPSAKLVNTSLATKVDKTFDSTLFDGASFPSGSVTDSGASIRFTTKNTNNNNTGTLDVALPVASGGTNGRAGIATKAQIDQIEQNRQDIALLSGKSSRYAINVNLSGMSASQIQTALTSAWRTASGQSTGDPNEYTTLVNLWNNHEYTWLDVSGTDSWVDRGISTVSTATNSSLGVVMGTPDPQDDTSNGCIFVEPDGTMNVLGWDDITTAISNNASDISSLQSGKVDKLTTSPAGTYPKVTVNAQGQVTSGTTLSASDIPSLSWSKITSGKPTTLSGYGITDAVQSNTPLSASATKCKITYDTKGLVTGGADLSASDIPALAISKITNLQTSLDSKLDDTQLVSTFSGHTSDDTYIPSAKLVNTELGKKQATLVSGTNIKTINSASILGSGNIALQTPLTAGTDYQVPLVGSGTGQNIKTVNNNSLVGTGNVAVQEVLVGSGTGQNIKTVGGTSILGSGNIPFPTVTNSNPTLAWSTKSKVGSVGSTDLEVTMPANPVTKTKIESVLGVSATYNNQAVVVKNGVLGFDEAGKVDDVKVNTVSVVTNKIANITVPTKVSELQNDTGFITGLGFDDLSSHPTTLSGYGITDAVQSNTAITGATKCKITYDSKGLVTAGANLSASDIPSLAISKITNLQTSLDGKLDDSQLVSTFTGYVADDTYIPSAKLTKDSLDTKLDMVTHTSGKYVYANDTGQLQIKLDPGADANTVAMRDNRGSLQVVNPSNTLDVANKSYVDTEDAKKVTGPSSSVDANIVLFDGTTGKLVKDSGFRIPPPALIDAGKVMRVDSNGLLTYNDIPVTSVNSKTGAVSLSASDVGALASDYTYPISLTQTGTSTITLAHNTVYTLTAGGSSVVFKTPTDNNSDTKVRQNIPTDATILSTNRPLLMSYLAITDTGTRNKDGVAYRSTGMYANISTNTITASHFYNSTTSTSLDFTVGSIIALTEVN